VDQLMSSAAPLLAPSWAYLEADSRGLVAVHGDRGKVIQGLEHIAVEGVPGHRGELLWDGGLRAGADVLTVEPGRRESGPGWSAAEAGEDGSPAGGR
jgi:hypothetical protein